MKKLKRNTVREIKRFMKVWEDVIEADRKKYERLENQNDFEEFYNKWIDTFLEFVKMADNTEKQLKELETIDINHYIKWE